MLFKTGRYFADVSWDGNLYNGWQVQPNAATIQETMEKAFSTLFKRKVSLTGAGRTDTGVHAISYTLHVDIEPEDVLPEVDQLIYKLNRILPPDIALNVFRKVKDDAHARYSAVARSYEYRICRKKDPFALQRAWIMERPLDLVLMNEVTRILFDYNDFQCFSKVNTQVNHYRCQIIEAHWREEDHFLIFSIKADRFLRNMVRAIVGTIVEAGLGKTSAGEFRNIIESKSRSMAGYSVPGSGLYFMGADYEQSVFDAEL
jgi:tRNA pseudouridine38-40 synthase